MAEVYKSKGDLVLEEAKGVANVSDGDGFVAV